MIIRQGDFVIDLPSGFKVEFHGNIVINYPLAADSPETAHRVNDIYRKPVVSVPDEAARLEMLDLRWKRIALPHPIPDHTDFVAALRAMPTPYEFNPFIATLWVLGLKAGKPADPRDLWGLMSTSKIPLFHEPHEMTKARDAMNRMRNQEPEKAKALEADWEAQRKGRDTFRQRMRRLLDNAIIVYNRDLETPRHFTEIERVRPTVLLHNGKNSFLDGKSTAFRKTAIPIGLPRPSPPPPTDPTEI